MKKKTRDYSQIKYDDLPKVREPGERKIIPGSIDIDYSVFKKTPVEKQRLKVLKAYHKQGINKLWHPGKAQRERIKLRYSDTT